MKRLLIPIVAISLVVIALLIALLTLYPSKIPGFEEEEPRAEKDGWVLEVQRIEHVSREGEDYPAVYVNCTNRGKKEWYVDPVKHFTLILEDGREIKAYGTSLWGSFYYIKTGESLGFYVVFPANSAKPVKLLVKLAGEEVMSVP